MIIYPDGEDWAGKSASASNQIERYPDLRTAGKKLALKLEHYRHQADLIVLGLVLGGVPVAHEVSEYLEAPLDLIIVRRLFAPQGPGSQTCAVNIAGRMVVPEEFWPLPQTPSKPIEFFVADAVTQLQKREAVCRGGRPPVGIAGKTAVLVDCGARSGMTMQAAIEALRTLDPRRIIAAMPVASSGSLQVLSTCADELILLASPHSFGHVGLWYHNFTRPEDEGVSELLAS